MGSSRLYEPFQSIGSRGVNNLASSLVLSQLPPTKRVFRLIVKPEVASKEEANPEAMSQIEVGLSLAETKIVESFTAAGLRAASFEAFRHLIVAGNTLLHRTKSGYRVFALSQYVVKRDFEGNMIELIVKESISEDEIPESVRAAVMGTEDPPREGPPPAEKPTEDNYDLFTHLYRDGKTWKLYQQVKDIVVPESETSYGKQRPPWIALRWHRISGEDYGRSHVDDYYGDLVAAESLSRSLIRAAAVSAKVVFINRRGGTTRAKDIQDAREGDVIDGDHDDVKPLTLDKYPDFQVAEKQLQVVTTRLSYAFLLSSAVQRDAERVTAEEIRLMIQQLQNTIGGPVTVLSVEFVQPTVEIEMALLQKAGGLPKMDKWVKVTIVTGIDALGRSEELDRLDRFILGPLQAFGPQVMPYIDLADYLRRRASSLDIDPKGLVHGPDQVAQQQQQAAAQQAVQHLGPHVIKALSDQQKAGAMPQQPQQQ